MPGHEGRIVGQSDHHTIIEVEGRKVQIPKGVLTALGGNTFRVSPGTQIEHVFPKVAKEEPPPARLQIAPEFIERLRNHPNY